MGTDRAQTRVSRRVDPVGLPFLRIDEHQIDVRRHVQLAPAELAHADHHELLLHALRIAYRSVTGMRLRFRPGLRRADRCVGQIAHRRAHFGQGREAGKIARHDAQEHPLAQLAQHPPRGLFVGAGDIPERRIDFCARERIGTCGVQLRGERGPRLDQPGGITRFREVRGERAVDRAHQAEIRIRSDVYS